jgi:hypothetical protein
MNSFELTDVLLREVLDIKDLSENLDSSDWEARTSGKPLREHESHHAAEGHCVGAPRRGYNLSATVLSGARKC